ncbi:biotin--[acetyl-CoA-carboxylase] ligase [Streptomyces sp. A3M-1-3]|uniref:biotin--[acetyl-CoA-carboxylase] ligase n=1 Tax=Streptomyces sp. A3M-1-3 TaxID=2962044 RepID=UPI0020B674D4|nr:biotin--[acetyl-CoA-carboxylase] ligase [Streptomyces sp. A3M-1-3]MCP3818989.1 biotin--[acetyl-CoA-carboxylase] ligase [Streptomyces sp. A3M-1-3]
MTPQDAPDNRWSNLDRPPLNTTALRRGLLRPGGLWTSLDVVQVTGSTNADLAARAAETPEGAVLVAEEQTEGRGRLGRNWSAPARSGLFFSILLKPMDVPVERWGWLPLLAGVATATALSRTAGVDTALKWPNDLLVAVGGEERKAGGILAERAGGTGGGVVVGIGLNVSLTKEELPVPGAGSLALAGAVSVDRDPLLRAVLRSLEEWYGEWRAAGGDPDLSRLQESYAAGCATLGRTVRAELPGGRSLTGEAVAVDADGRLVLATGDGVQEPVGAGDIVHLRSVDS